MQKISFWIMVLFYLAAGSNHFINPGFYIQIMPPYLPWQLGLIYISGLLEICFALLLIPIRTRKLSSIFIIALLIAIFPANIYMAVNFWQNSKSGLWLALLRLPIQFLLIWWAWNSGKYKAAP